jgi:hypothetical protein
MATCAGSEASTAHSDEWRRQKSDQAATGLAPPLRSITAEVEGREATVCAWVAPPRSNASPTSPAFAIRLVDLKIDDAEN